MKHSHAGLISIAAAVIALAIAAAPVSAKTDYGAPVSASSNGIPSRSHPVTSDPQSPVTQQMAGVVDEGDGFDWGSAFVGAGAAIGLALVSVVTVQALKRRRRIAAFRS